MINQMKVEGISCTIPNTNLIKGTVHLFPFYYNLKYSRGTVYEMADGAVVLVSEDNQKLALVRDGVLKVSRGIKWATIYRTLDFIYQFYDRDFEYKNDDDLLARFGDENDVVFKDEIVMLTRI